MRNTPLLLSLSAVALIAATSARASPGDVVVPAHRTKDGNWVPANVPPVSGGTHFAHRPGRGRSIQRVARASSSGALLPPLLVEAQPIRR